MRGQRLMKKRGTCKKDVVCIRPEQKLRQALHNASHASDRIHDDQPAIEVTEEDIIAWWPAATSGPADALGSADHHGPKARSKLSLLFVPLTEAEEVSLVRPGQTVTGFFDAKLHALVRKHPGIPVEMEDVVTQLLRMAYGRSITDLPMTAQPLVEAVAEVAQSMWVGRPPKMSP